MKKIMLLLLIPVFSNAQEVFFYSGKNFTKYDYKSSDGSKPDLFNRVGDYYEIGYQDELIEEKLNYQLSLTYNEYNSSGGDSANIYRWQSSYAGIKGNIVYNLFDAYRSGFQVNLKAGANFSTIVNGEQEINGTLYDLSDEDEFKGLQIQPTFGFNVNYAVSDIGYLSVGYNFSKSFRMGAATEEKLSFNNSQLQFGIHIPIN